MRVKPFTLLAALTFAGLCSTPLTSQETGGSGSPTGEGEVVKPVVDEVKLIAQRAAMSSLTGENPFVLRESSWNGEIDPGKARLIQLQLFKRNEYHFWMAVPDRKAGVNLNVYDGKGQLVETENSVYDVGNVAGLIVRPSQTGVYYLRISLQTTIASPQKWSVIYAWR
jgi:hypothetical protein